MTAPDHRPAKEAAMKKRTVLPVLLMLWAVSFYLWNAPHPAAQAADVSLQQVVPFTYCCMTVKGSYAQIQEAIGKMTLAMEFQRVAPTGPLMGIFYNSPEDVDSRDLEWEIGFPITPRQGIQPPLALKEWSYTQVAASLHKGPYADVGKTIAKIMEWMAANGYAPAGPMLERYLDMNPSEMKPEDLRTEVWFPCQKK
jgi:AraC family transcriptional regulator